MKRNESGFTLLEVLLAVSIFGFTLLATTLIGSNATDEADLTQRLTHAEYLMREKMEEVVLGQDECQDGESGSYDDPALAGYVWRVLIEDIPFLGVSEDDLDSGGRDGGSSTSQEGRSRSGSRGGSTASRGSDSQKGKGSAKGTGKRNTRKRSGGGLFDESGSKGGKAGGKGSAAAGEEAGDQFGEETSQEEWLQKITIELTFPYYRGPQTIRATTYVPMLTEEEDGAASDEGSKAGAKNQGGQSQRSGGRNQASGRKAGDGKR